MGGCGGGEGFERMEAATKMKEAVVLSATPRPLPASAS